MEIISSRAHVLARSEFVSRGRLFVCGDIHGCYDELMQRLRIVGFDAGCDRLVALGDLVDRGPKSEEVLALIEKPWFTSIRGNHEALMIQAVNGDPAMHIINGGIWLAHLPANERMRLAALAMELPVALTVISPSRRKIGFVHADVPGDDWDAFIERLDCPQVQEYAMWARDRVRTAKRNLPLTPIRNVDHVYFGHTPLAEPLSAANMSWIDTGCFATGKLTLEEIA
ncbi:MAG: serine/threonine-protein phosphatase 2 [Sphingobium sp.]|nr:MAG: serine/threonine-protein phosphatase 2 [Sphingobium sp.]